MRKLGGPKPSDQDTDLDISPLIDVVFILLIFFMVSTTFVKDAQVDLTRPEAQSAQKASMKAIRVQIDRNGAVLIEGHGVKTWMLQSRVRDLLRSGRDRDVLVIADRATTTQNLVDVVDQCRLGGASHVAVATDREAG